MELPDVNLLRRSQDMLAVLWLSLCSIASYHVAYMIYSLYHTRKHQMSHANIIQRLSGPQVVSLSDADCQLSSAVAVVHVAKLRHADGFE